MWLLGQKILALLTWNDTLLKLLSSSDNTQHFDHDKLSSISQLIKDKSRDLQKLLKYFNGITTSVFKGAAGGCSG